MLDEWISQYTNKETGNLLNSFEPEKKSMLNEDIFRLMAEEEEDFDYEDDLEQEEDEDLEEDLDFEMDDEEDLEDDLEEDEDEFLDEDDEDYDDEEEEDEEEDEEYDDGDEVLYGVLDIDDEDRYE
jgi:hypothetical protein